MSLKHGLLGLLSYGSMTGYELDKTFKDSLFLFWKAQTSQIYRELNGMEQSGWLTSEIVYQTDKPNKKLYSLTESGRKELHAWLSENNLDNEFQTRSTFLMKLFFSGEKNSGDNIEMLKEYKVRCLEELDALKTVGGSIEHYSQFTSQNREPVYWGLTARFGELHIKACLEFAEEAIKTLEKLQ
ncbi:PadR family transcriptional regulator [uncultured Clostridium sp.]|uniref:PadR family transcriptional regulator n=1 Tax=uncultured Clostridium sp. TaxID=59620 RepID=UPI0025FA0C0E|nr:PadR family transcriptional regulator [uncultured Clostridium sp.]